MNKSKYSSISLRLLLLLERVVLTAKLPLIFIYILFFSQQGFSQYCVPVVSNNGAVPVGDSIGIINVTFNTINNNSAAKMGYENFTGISTTLAKGRTYNLTLTGGYTNQSAFAWIDYDQDNIFNGTNEAVAGNFFGFPGFTPTILRVAGITIPTTAQTGATRLRVASSETLFCFLANNCTDMLTGDVEEYTVNIIDTFYVRTYQDYGTCINPGSINQNVLLVEVVNTDNTIPFNITDFNFNTNGTTNAGDLLNAKLWYTGETRSFDCATKTLYGTFNNPNGNFTINGSQPLLTQSRSNYFWLTYDVAPAAPPGNVIDAECISVTINATNYNAPVPTTLAGNRVIGNSSTYQNREANIWYVSRGQGIDFNCSPPVNITNPNVNFCSNGATSNSGECPATACDKNGNLLFYTDGKFVFDRCHNQMPNGFGMGDQGLTSMQGSLIIPKPGTTDRYYIFNTDQGITSTSITAIDPTRGGSLMVSEVDMNLNGGFGDVVAATKNDTLLKNIVNECLTAVLHCNKRDVWVLVGKQATYSFYAYLITPTGIQAPVVSTVPWGIIEMHIKGNLKFSPNGRRLVYNPLYRSIIPLSNGRPVLFDFDNSTGTVSNPQVLTAQNGGAASFSNDNSKLYLGSQDNRNLYQYDLCVSPLNRVLIGTNPGLMWALQNAPDGKIYTNRNDPASDYMSVINNPNAAGAACNFNNNGFELKGASVTGGVAYTLPSSFIESYFNASTFAMINGDYTATTVCLGDSTQFTEITPALPGCGNPSRSWIWYFGDPVTGNADTSYLEHPKHLYSAAGTFTVTRILNQGCESDTVIKTVVVNAPPTVSFTYNEGCPCNIINFTSGGTGTSWQWTFGDGTTSASQHPSHTYAKPGSYYVKLTVTDANGCTNSFTDVLIVCGADFLPFTSKSDNHWMFPQNAGVSFSSGSPVFAPGSQATSAAGEGGSTISHPVTGALLFYTHDENVWDATHTIMPNGSGLTTGGSTSEGSLIVPFPGDTNKYYILTLSGSSDDVAIPRELRYSVVDMTLNGGLGDIVPGQKNIFLYTTNGNEGLTGVEKLAATCNNKAQYWAVIAPSTTPPNCGLYHAFLIDSTGINTPPVTSNLAAQIPPENCGTGGSFNLWFSKNGGKMAHVTGGILTMNAGVVVLDFDKNTGLFSNPIGVRATRATELIMYAQFSPDNKILYTSSFFLSGGSKIMQFDLRGPNPQATVDSVYVSATNAAAQMWPGLDDKIYFTNFSVPFLGVINNPNVIGPGANVNQTAIPLGGNIGYHALQNIVPLELPLKDTIIANYTYTLSNCNEVAFTNNNPQLTPDPCSFYPHDTLTYSWDFDDGSPLSFQRTPPTHTFAPGTYDVMFVVYRARTCNSDTFIQSIVVPPNLTITMSANNVLCYGGATGSASVTVLTGSFPYTYAWAAPAGGTGAMATGLTTGVYSTTVTDTNGCIAQATVTVAEPPALSFTLTPVNLLCENDNSGSIGSTVSGGTASHTYSWSNGATTNDITNLAAGIYSLTVTDNNGCSATGQETLTEPAPISFTTTSTPDNCAQTNGTASVTAVAGGTNPFTYSWNTGATTSGISNLTSGNYTVTVTDDNNCSHEEIVFVNAAGADAINLVNITHNTCNNSCDGEISLALSGTSNGPYTYSWNTTPAQTTLSASGLCAGLYSVTVTAGNGCTATAQHTITEPAVLSATLTPSNLLCNGDNTGGITSITGGGTFPYTYNWNTGATSDNITNIGAGTYTLIITDNNGCSITLNETITEPAVLTATLTPSGANCNLPTGDISVAVAGGIPNYSYLWNTTPAQTTSLITGLLSGIYQVTVTDANGCSIVDNTTVINIPGVTMQPPVINNVTCFGLCDGSATISGNGGNTPYLYNWSSGQTTDIVTGMCAGIYSATITDDDGCLSTAVIDITEPAILTTTVTVTDLLCNNDNSGSATGIIAGGTSPYYYSWSTGSTTGNITNLSTGIYSLTVTDDNGCSATTQETITEPAVLSATLTPTNLLCNNDNTGGLTSAVNGGTGPYLYSWSTGATTTNITNLSAGSYSFTVTDNNGCSITLQEIITQPAILNATLTPINLLCNNDNSGGIISAVGGGTSPYNYSWSNGVTNSNITNLTAGTYSLTVTDDNGCSATAQETITEPDVISFTTTSTPDNCSQSNGTADVTTVTGGTGAYIYSWNNGATTSGISNVASGNYTVTVTDNNNCSRSELVAVNAEGADAINLLNITHNTCNNSCDGEISLSLSGTSNGPYTYSWNTVPAQTTLSASGLCAGIYSVTVTDNNGCTATSQHTVNEPAVLSATLTPNNLLCNNDNSGSMTSAVNGGTATYNYNWSTGETTTTITNLAAGIYSLTVTDLNGCSTIIQETINEPAVLSATLTPNNLLCNNDNTGSVTSVVNGGTSPYTYSWNNTATTNNITNLPVGNYSLTVTDDNGCSVTVQTTLTEPDVISFTTTTTPDYCSQSNGTANATTVTGGTSPYTYSWSTGATTAGISNLAAGNYTLTVTDNNSCTLSQSIVVDAEGADAINLLNIKHNTCNNSCDGEITLALSGTSNGPYTYSWNTVPVQTTLSATGLCAGTYSLLVTDNNGCTATSQHTITQPAVLSATLTPTHLLCNNDNSGSMTSAVNGGTATYNYNWSTGETTATITNLAAGIYSLTVSDNNGCSITIQETVTEPAILSATLTPTNLLCNNDNSGSITSIVTGGTTPYNYSWNNSATTISITNLAAGNYSLTLTDNNGCTSTVQTTLTQPAVISYTITTTPDHCFQSSGTASVSTGGGTPPYAYSWNNGNTNIIATGLAAGNYTVTIRDNNACMTSATVTIIPMDADTLELVSITNASCFNGCDGIITLQMSGNNAPPYNYTWSTTPAQNSLVATGLCAGVYTCSVTDINGCSGTISATISQPSVLSASLTSTSTLCFGDNTGTASIQTSGGTPSHTYLWNNGETTNTISGLVAGTYTVLVTDGNTCSLSQQVTVVDAPDIIVTIANPGAICVGNQATLSTTVSGGTGTYRYLWDAGQTTNTISVSPLQTASYTLTVFDSNGCSKQAEVQVVVNPLPIILFEADTTTGCGPLCVNFLNTTPNSQSQTWNFGDGTNSSASNPENCYTQPGQYSVVLTVTDNNGCNNTRTENNYITVHPNPVASFTATPQPTTIVNPRIVFTDESQNAVSWVWNFSDVVNNSSSLQHPTYIYNDTGKYVVTLIVTNSFGCKDTTELNIIIDNEFLIFIPNTFSPNSDGLNEVFIPTGMDLDNLERYEFFVFSRWGNIIFESTDPAVGWDGRANGGTDVAQQDTYVYLIKLRNKLGINSKYVGHVNLIR